MPIIAQMSPENNEIYKIFCDYFRSLRIFFTEIQQRNKIKK